MIGYSLVNQKGQITIPSSIRKALGISPSHTVTVEKHGDAVTIKKIRNIFSLRGSVKTKKKLPSKTVMRKAFFEDLTKKK